MKKLSKAIEATREYYLRDDKPWIIGYSGGKDSSLVIKVLLTALAGLKNSNKELRVLYCDTGVEIPVLRQYIFDSLERIRKEAETLGIRVVTEAIQPPISERYFVKVIGKGYPSPTNKFRWCTDRLRISPIQTAIKELVGSKEAIVALGTRYSESESRDKILAKYATDSEYIFNQSGYKNTKLFCPIIDFNTEDVWQGLVTLDNIRSISTKEIADIYKKISGECPIVKLPDTNPCSKGRFGCWTCTVVSRDKATENLIENGHVRLKPLQEFRSWLLEIRDNTSYRCTVRRNGNEGLGPFRLNARREILKELMLAEEKSGYKLIDNSELEEIYKLWEIDENSVKYREDFASKKSLEPFKNTKELALDIN